MKWSLMMLSLWSLLAGVVLSDDECEAFCDSSQFGAGADCWGNECISCCFLSCAAPSCRSCTWGELMLPELKCKDHDDAVAAANDTGRSSLTSAAVLPISLILATVCAFVGFAAFGWQRRQTAKLRQLLLNKQQPLLNQQEPHSLHLTSKQEEVGLVA